MGRARKTYSHLLDAETLPSIPGFVLRCHPTAVQILLGKIGTGRWPNFEVLLADGSRVPYCGRPRKNGLFSRRHILRYNPKRLLTWWWNPAAAQHDGACAR